MVVDASLDPGIYLGLAKARGWTIRHVLETHIHADHLSRARALAAGAGARLWLPEQDRVSFPYDALREGSEIAFGTGMLEALSTPGHTGESMSFLTNGWLLTGDTLFLAGVGRPDLEATAEESRARAALLYHSLHRLLALDPDLLVLPAHTGTPIAFDGAPVTATLARVRESVRLPASAQGFVEHVLGRIPVTPPNHHTIVRCNETGEFPPGDPTELEAGANRCAIS